MNPFKFLLLIALVAIPAGPALAQTRLAPTDDEQKAFLDISRTSQQSGFEIQKQILQVAMAQPRDDQKLCDLSKAYTAAEEAATDQEQAYLQKLADNGRSIDKLIPAFLSWGHLADGAIIHEADYCAAAVAVTTKVDDTQKAVVDVHLMMDRLSAGKAALDDATRAGNRLGRLRAIQSEAAFLDEIVSGIQTIRDYGAAYSDEARSLIAQLPQYQAELAAAKALDKAEIKPFTDPAGEDDAPYVYTPLSLPAVPDDDQTFQKVFGMTLLSALRPQMEALKQAVAGDAPHACAYSRDTVSDLERVRAFAQTYVDKQKAAGKPTEVGQKALDQVAQAVQSTTAAADRTCAQAEVNTDKTAKANAISADLMTLQPKYIEAGRQLNASMQAHDAVKTCTNSKTMLGLMDQLIKDFDGLLELSGQPMLMTNAQKAQLDQLKTNLATLRSQREQMRTLNRNACAASSAKARAVSR